MTLNAWALLISRPLSTPHINLSIEFSGFAVYFECKIASFMREFCKYPNMYALLLHIVCGMLLDWLENGYIAKRQMRYRVLLCIKICAYIYRLHRKLRSIWICVCVNFTYFFSVNLRFQRLIWHSDFTWWKVQNANKCASIIWTNPCRLKYGPLLFIFYSHE